MTSSPASKEKNNKENQLELNPNWPETFKVCESHKTKFYNDYRKARTDIEGACVICDPVDNDSLGG